MLAALLTRLAPSDNFTPLEQREGIRWWMRHGIGSQAMDTLTVGAFLTAFALELGASTIVIGLLAAIPHLTQVLQIVGVYLDDRWRNRRLICVLFTGASRPLILLMAAAAFVQPPALAMALFASAFAARYALTALMACSWDSWIRDLVPDTQRGKLTSRRLTLMSLVSIVLGLVAAGFIDVWKAFNLGPATVAFAILFALAFIGGVAGTWCMSKMREPRATSKSFDLDLPARLRRPFHDANFRRLLAFTATWNFAINLAAPFFMVHMLNRLGLELSLVMALTLLSQAVNILVLRRWGDVVDRFSNKSVLLVCAPLFIACIFAWTFTTFPDRHALTIPLLVAIHALTGFATAGVTVASGNIAMKLAPRGDATAYLAANSLLISLAAGVAPVVGGFAAHFFTERELSLILRWRAPEGALEFGTLSLTHWDFFFAMATIVGLIAVVLLGRVREVGEVEEKVVLSEMYLQARRFVQNVSSIAGLHQAGQFPFASRRHPHGSAPRRPEADETSSEADGEAN